MFVNPCITETKKLHDPPEREGDEEKLNSKTDARPPATPAMISITDSRTVGYNRC